MRSANHDTVNQGRLSPEATPTLDCEPDVEATIASLKQHFETVREHEVRRLRGRLGELNSIQQNAVESLTRRIVDQILEAPMTVLKATSDNHDSAAVIETVRRLFSLGGGSGLCVVRFHSGEGFPS